MGGPSTKSQVDVGRNGVESRKGCRKEYRKEWCRIETVGHRWDVRELERGSGRRESTQDTGNPGTNQVRTGR